MADRDDWLDLARSQDQAANLARRDLKAWWRRVVTSQTAPEQVRDALLELVPALAQRYGEVAATAALEVYERLRSQATGLPAYEAVLAPGVPAADIQREVRRLVAPLWRGTPALALEQISRALGITIAKPARDSIVLNAARDPAKPGWARVPSPGACAWCRLLASRGTIYSSRKTAGGTGQYHDDCRCQMIPVFKGQAIDIPGYDPVGLREEYETARARAVDAGRASPTDREISAEMRRGARGSRSRDGTLVHDAYHSYRLQCEQRLKDMPEDGRLRLTPPPIPPEAPASWPRDLPALTAKSWSHILYGDQDGGGAHLHGYGWLSGGVEAPASWTPERYLEAIEQTVRAPESQEGLIYSRHLPEGPFRVMVSKRRVITAYFLEEGDK